MVIQVPRLIGKHFLSSRKGLGLILGEHLILLKRSAFIFSVFQLKRGKGAEDKMVFTRAKENNPSQIGENGRKREKPPSCVKEAGMKIQKYQPYEFYLMDPGVG